MPTLTAQNIDDLVQSTQDELGKDRYSDIASDLQEYHVMTKLMKKERMLFGSGIGIRRNVMVAENPSVREVGLGEADIVNISDHMKHIFVPFRRLTGNWAYDVVEVMMNSKPAQIVELVKVRRLATMIDFARVMEQAFWNKPADSTDRVKVFGVDYWLVANDTAGFNGGNPSGFPAGAGDLSSITYPNWSNYTDKYTNVTKDDLISKMRTARRKTNFLSPIQFPEYTDATKQKFSIYVDEVTIKAIETIGEQQNENLGRDVASMDGQISFGGNPIIWVPQLDTHKNAAGTANNSPVYMINWGCMCICFLEGDFMREGKPKESPKSHNMREVHTDTTWQVLCDNRRKCAVLTLGA
jgi:hypothetical protein